ncbi:MAG: hypothetical protein P8P98_02770 [Emcibacteraceae bacterium]|nr:hypothetical protein [Emcibacteraceae bacterium]MDG1996937.1 hypothetical protein [Emcibacteraceae bacterium]
MADFFNNNKQGLEARFQREIFDPMTDLKIKNDQGAISFMFADFVAAYEYKLHLLI